MRYSGKKAIVVGGTHGMGRAVVEQLAKEGARVIATGSRTVTTARQDYEGLESVTVHQVDVTSLADIEELGLLAARELGEVDLVHFNAGTAELGPFEAVTEESYDRSFAINTKGAFFTVQRLLPLVAPGGSVVFTSSVADTGGTGGMAVYAGAKAAVVAFARTLAAEVVGRGIRVNVVAPGFIDTPTMGVPGLTKRQRAEFMAIGDAQTPMKRHGTPDEVASAVLYLAFDATFSTGARLAVDGGIDLHLQAV